jgi:hypothetical protein
MRHWAKRFYSRAGGATAALGTTSTSVTARHDDESSNQDEVQAGNSKTASRIVAEICLREGIERKPRGAGDGRSYSWCCCCCCCYCWYLLLLGVGCCCRRFGEKQSRWAALYYYASESSLDLSPLLAPPSPARRAPPTQSRLVLDAGKPKNIKKERDLLPNKRIYYTYAGKP